MKFGKQIQKRQLEVPEYAASFVNYKALKKLLRPLLHKMTATARPLLRTRRRRSSSHDRASRGARPSSPRSKRASSSSLPISTSSSSSSRSMVRPFQRFLRSGTRHPSPRQRSCTSREPSRSNRSSMRPSSASCRIRPPPAFRNSVPGQMESRSTSTRRLPGM
ncbi:hypothetical protein M440DRAFT_1076469 [Trichoderma longibrachiatum ATCC 18648]|uniref:SPX domain-containing protein n=1 Tax=Trichoderma longibrachiatum ATCC 18648 TaxID=983965 RepID=A0A2T4BVB6_TRILO|nr:hypothetical protein M440DRAFT_1076469 [Trichoderma longibrachiatum ATCC 18648]